jgi:hypothetical protein
VAQGVHHGQPGRLAERCVHRSAPSEVVGPGRHLVVVSIDDDDIHSTAIESMIGE